MKRLTVQHQQHYYNNLFSNHSSVTDLWRTINSFARPKQAPLLPTVSSDSVGASLFASFFSDKILKLHQQFAPSCRTSPVHVCHPVQVPLFEKFDLVSPPEVFNFISKSKPKTSPLDPIPTWIVKKLPALFTPVLCSIVNLSLSAGVFPESEKQAIVTPVLKKRSLDKDDCNNYRPISVLSFISKLIESVVSKKIDQFLDTYGLFSPFQSAYRVSHSTETVLLHLTNHFAVARSSHLISCMITLDLSSAFDTVDHEILLDRLHHNFNFSGVVLQFFSSYLNNRTQTIRFNSQLSDSYTLSCGVPQGSVLGPRLYSLYVAPVSEIIRSYNLSHHMNADDTCLYFSFSPADASDSIENFECCILHSCD